MKKSSSFVKVLSVAMILAAANSFFGCKNNSDSDEETDTTTSTTKPVEEQNPGDNLIEDDFTAAGWESNIYDQKNEVGVRVKADFKATKTSFTADVTKCDHELDDYSCGIQLKRVVTVADEKTYKLTFDIEVDKDAKAKWALLGHKGDDYPWYGGGDLDLKAGEKKTITGTVKLSSKAAENAYKPDYETLLAFDFLSVAKFTVTNVKFELVDTTQSPPPSIPEGTIPEGATKASLSGCYIWGDDSNGNAQHYTKTVSEDGFSVQLTHTEALNQYKEGFGCDIAFGTNNRLMFTITNNKSDVDAKVKVVVKNAADSSCVASVFENGTEHTEDSTKQYGWTTTVPKGGSSVFVIAIADGSTPKDLKVNLNSESEKAKNATSGDITISDVYVYTVGAGNTGSSGGSGNTIVTTPPEAPEGCTYDYSTETDGAKKWPNINAWWDGTYKEEFESKNLTGKKIVVCFKVENWAWSTNNYGKEIDVNICSEIITEEGENKGKQKKASKYQLMGESIEEGWLIKEAVISNDWAAKDDEGDKAEIDKIIQIRINTCEGAGDLYVRYVNIVDAN